VEEQVAHSTALHAHIVGRGEYLLGPLARFALNAAELSPVAAAAADEAGLSAHERNPFRSIVVRAVEVLYACDEGLRIIDRYREPDRPAVDVDARAGVGCGWTEAPRGMLWHRYECDADGSIVHARIVPPTSQNQAAIERDLFHFVEEHVDLPDEELGRRAEQVIRSYDPCISCATHFLDLTVDRA
jgi:coenzyme F420-reducing hydrogenase alpha subunit